MGSTKRLKEQITSLTQSFLCPRVLLATNPAEDAIISQIPRAQAAHDDGINHHALEPLEMPLYRGVLLLLDSPGFLKRLQPVFKWTADVQYHMMASSPQASTRSGLRKVVPMTWFSAITMNFASAAFSVRATMALWHSVIARLCRMQWHRTCRSVAFP